MVMRLGTSGFPRGGKEGDGRAGEGGDGSEVGGGGGGEVGGNDRVSEKGNLGGIRFSFCVCFCFVFWSTVRFVLDYVNRDKS